MFGMREGLKLTRAAGGPIAKRIFPHSFFQNTSEKLRLRGKAFRGQPGGFAHLLKGGEIDMSRQILLTGIRQQIVTDTMTGIGAERAMRARRRKPRRVKSRWYNCPAARPPAPDG